MKRASQAEIELGKMGTELNEERQAAHRRREEIDVEIATLTSTIETMTARIDALRQARQTSSDRQKPKHS